VIDPADLSPEQYAGHACVLDGYPLPPHAVAVGLLGWDGHYVFACPHHPASLIPQLVMERRYPADRSSYVPDPIGSPSRTAAVAS
jgi:hypothetical protein